MTTRTIADIMTPDPICYGPELVDECVEFCKARNITYLPSLDKPAECKALGKAGVLWLYGRAGLVFNQKSFAQFWASVQSFLAQHHRLLNRMRMLA